jgi:hypothetical protein
MYTHVCWVDNGPGGSLSRHGEIALWGESRPVLPVCSAAVMAATVSYRAQGIALKW